MDVLDPVEHQQPEMALEASIDPSEAVLAAAENIIETEARRVEAAGYLGVLASPAPDMKKVDQAMATMFTNVHGKTGED